MTQINLKNQLRIIEIPLDKIGISQFNVRKDLQAGLEDSTIDDLAKSISEKGLLTPVTVLEKEGRYELIVGQRRYLACQLLGWQDIPAFVRSNLDDVDARILSLIENVHRADLSPMDKARAYDEIYKIYGTYSQVSKETGASNQTIKRYILLMSLSPLIQSLLNTKDGPAGICTLSKLAEFFPSHKDQEIVIDKIKGLPSQTQEEIIIRSEGDVSKIDELVWQALGGAFDRFVCHGLESCPYIPKECLDEIKQIISSFEESEIFLEENNISQKEDNL